MASRCLVNRHIRPNEPITELRLRSGLTLSCVSSPMFAAMACSQSELSAAEQNCRTLQLDASGENSSKQLDLEEGSEVRGQQEQTAAVILVNTQILI